MEQLASWIRSKLGCGYVYGATGWICTQARLEQQAKQYPQYADTILTVCRKWIGLQCFDCAQLVKLGLREFGVSIPSGATSQWNADVWAEKGPIAQMPQRLCALYRGEGKKMEHAGWHLGGGTVIDARSSARGVIESALAQYPWTHYAIPEGLEKTGGNAQEEAHVEALYQAVVQTQRDPLRIREAPEDGRIVGHVPKGAQVGVLSVAQAGWPLIRYEGVTGYVSGEYLAAKENEGMTEGGAYLLLTDGAGNTWRPQGGFRAEIKA